MDDKQKCLDKDFWDNAVKYLGVDIMGKIEKVTDKVYNPIIKYEVGEHGGE